uniref:Uncharacterized protein n=1 Tax=Anguilla anguilla TaxID=7936 RepID=A0A0E9UPB9_ANGAN
MTYTTIYTFISSHPYCCEFLVIPLPKLVKCVSKQTLEVCMKF